MSKTLIFSANDIADWIAFEKNQYSEYTQLCTRYQITPDPIAAARNKGRVEVLETILANKTHLKTL